jgi:hypothetical protein
MTWSARISQRDYERLLAHLHPGDDDEHAAFLYAGEAATPDGNCLLVRRVIPVDAADFGPSDRGGYRQITAQAIARAAIACEHEGLRLLWAHSHPGASTHVGFSEPDLMTHRRAHPHMIDMTDGKPVASLVVGTDSIAGEVWTADGGVFELEHVDVVGARMQRLAAAPASARAPMARFARQVLMFGAGGQQALSRLTVGIAGGGGGGSRDARRHNLKVDVLRRMVAAIDPQIEVVALAGDIRYAEDARMLLACDFIFSATDTQFARFAVNALCHQYLIPGAQVGAKVVSDDAGHIQLAYAMHRPIDFGAACLECGGAIDAESLRKEQLDGAERRAQTYVDDPGAGIVDPSVITLNSAAVALAMLDFQFAVTGMFPARTRLSPRIYHAPERELRARDVRMRPGCRWCDRDAVGGAFARGDDFPLPLRTGEAPRPAPRGLFERVRSLGGRAVAVFNSTPPPHGEPER